MPELCEFLDRWGFLLNYKGNIEVVRQSRVRLFCGDQPRSERCA